MGAGFKKIFLLITLFLSVGTTSFCQTGLLQSGPMVGYSDMKEVLLWVQTTKEAKVKFEYWKKDKPLIRYTTNTKLTNKEEAFTAKLKADKVEPGNLYSYEVFLNGKKVSRPYPLEFESQVLWQWRTDPPPFKVALGSCAFVNDSIYDRPGKPYGGNYEIFESIYKKDPNVMLWLGDNIYLREPDWNTETGIFYRYTHGRSLPELQALLGSVHHYAIWDDHDFGPNDSDRSFLYKDVTLNAFKLFWCNPTFGVNDLKCTATTFEWADVQFFLLDDRYFKSPNKRTTGEMNLLGKPQIEWLIDALKYSQASFKMIACGTQVLNPLKVYENYSNYEEELNYLLERIEKEKIDGVFFVTGDRHQTELIKRERKDNYPLYDLTVSPLTSSAARSMEENSAREVGTFANERNFAIIDFSGTRKERIMKVSIFNSKGEPLWDRSFKASELKSPILLK